MFFMAGIAMTVSASDLDKGFDGLAAYQAGDFATAVQLFLPLAESGSDEAQYWLGQAYDGLGGEKNAQEAVRWWKKAAAQKHIGARYSLAVAYQDGKGVSKNYRKALVYFQLVEMDPRCCDPIMKMLVPQFIHMLVPKVAVEDAEHGDAAAKYLLALQFRNGEFGKPSNLASVDWFYKAGIAYLKEGNKDKALQMVEEINDTVPNHFLAQTLLAEIYGKQISGSDKLKQRSQNQKLVKQTKMGTAWPAYSGHVVTNYHVVNGSNTITLIRKDGTKISAKILKRDKANDIAILQATDQSKLPVALPLSDTGSNLGAKVFTVGYPHPDLMGVSPKLTSGEISGTSGLQDDPRVYQISVPVQAGNSGGPLLNMNGEVVGIVTSKLNAAKIFKWTGDLPQNVNYAVKIEYVRALLDSETKPTSTKVLPRSNGTTEELAARVQDSILMVIAE